jgi:hypothetical protein
MGLMTGKRGLIMGLANDKSIAWGIARAVAAEGAELAFSYQGEQLLKRVGRWPSRSAPPSCCPATWAMPKVSTRSSPRSRPNGAASISSSTPSAFPTRTSLRGRYVDTSPANFAMTMDISVYSFTAVCQRAEKMMPNGGSLLTLTYFGRRKGHAALQRHGRGQGGAGGLGHVSGRGPGPRRHPRERDQRRHDQDAGGLGHRRFPLHPEMEREQRAAAPDRHAGGGRQIGALPAVRPVAAP